MRVTVLMPTHNYGKWISGAIKSIFKQDYLEKYPEGTLSIVVVDDNSTDNTKEIIEEIKKEDNRGVGVGYVKNVETRGPSFSRNQGIKATIQNTDIYAMLDADDEYQPNKISRCVEKMIEFSDIGLVSTDFVNYSDDKGYLNHEYRPPYDRNVLERECIIYSGALYRANLLAKSGIYDEEMRVCEDYDLWLRLTEHTIACHIAEPLSVRRVTGLNSDQTVPLEIWHKNWDRIRNKLAAKHK